jgi:hypothetical protein
MRVVNVTVSRPSDPEPARMRDAFADVARFAIAHAQGAREGEHADAILERRHGASAAMRIRAGVAAGGVADQGTSASSADAWFPGVEDVTIPLALNLRDVPFNVRVLQPDESATGYWLAEGAAGPLSLFAVEGAELPAKRVQGLAVFSAESLADPRVEARIIGDLRRAAAGAINSRWFSDAAGTDAAPAGLFHGVTPTASSGNPAADMGALLESFAGDLTQAAVLCDPATAAQLAVLGYRGAKVAGRGEVAGLPQWSSRDFLRDSSGGFLALVDQGAISRGFDGIEIARSKDTTLSMTDGAGGDVMVSMFQNDLVAFRISARLNWKVARLAAVALVNAVNYSSAS